MTIIFPSEHKHVADYVIEQTKDFNFIIKKNKNGAKDMKIDAFVVDELMKGNKKVVVTDERGKNLSHNFEISSKVLE